MRYMLIILGTILGILYIIMLNKGSKYKSLVEPLSEDEFPLAELYTAGYAWAETPIFKFKGKLAYELKGQAGLLYEVQYAEYYANVIWAQTISLVHLFLTATFLLSSIMYDNVMLILGGGLFLSVIIGVYCLQSMKNKIAERTTACDGELAEVVSTMAILVNSGMMLRDAWQMISENKDEPFYRLMKQATENMRNGYSDADAIYLFGKASNSTEIKKFTSALLQSMEKGGGELGTFLANQSSELWSTKRQKKLQEGEKAATKLLAPIVLIFVGIILIVITAAFGGALF